MPDARLPTPLRAAVAAGSALAVLGTLHQLRNQRLLPVPSADPPRVEAPVSLLVPARDEAHRIAPTIRSLLAQTGLADAEVLVLDDGSTDGTAAVVRAAAAGDPRLRLLTGAPPPPGALGKPHACAQLAAAARGEILVHVDADVVLAPHAVAAAVALMGGAEPVDLLSPWPRQVAEGPAARLVQPLLAWSWLVMLPLAVAQRSRRPSMVAANGQFLLVTADALRQAGGWEAVAGEVLDDIAVARAVRRSGGRTGIADGSRLACCRMYDDGRQLAAGYHKSLWAAFGSGPGAAAVAALLGVVYVLPPVAALRGSRVGMIGYAAAVVSRALAARRTGARGWPDAFAHPLSITAVLGLLAASWVGRRAGTLRWKGRVL